MFEGGQHDVTLAKLMSAPRPMLVHFLGPAKALLPCDVTSVAARNGLVALAPSAGGGEGSSGSGSGDSAAAPAPRSTTTTVALDPPPLLAAAAPGAPPPLAEEKGLFEEII